MKKLIMLVLTAVVIVSSGFGHGVKGMRRGVRKSTYSSHSSGGHGIHGCGVPYCHGAKCQGSSSSSSMSYGDKIKTVNTVNSTVKTACTVSRTIDMHRKTEKDLEYKDLRNEKLRRELENNRQMDRRVIIVRENQINSKEDTNIEENQDNEKSSSVQKTTSNMANATSIVAIHKPATCANCPICDQTVHYTRKECPKCHKKIKVVFID